MEKIGRQRVEVMILRQKTDGEVIRKNIEGKARDEKRKVKKGTEWQ